jgi:hypothetical protein
MAGTYKGPDTSQSFAAIRPVPPPIISPVNLSYFAECDPAHSNVTDSGIFTLCGFKADNYTDITSVEDFYQYYEQVCITILDCKFGKWKMIFFFDRETSLMLILLLL